MADVNKWNVGGLATLNSPQSLDPAILSALAEWNRINEVLLARPSIFAEYLGIFWRRLRYWARSKNLHLSIPLPTIWNFMHEVGLTNLLVWMALLLILVVVFELTLLTKRRDRIVEFGQLLGIAIGYRSNWVSLRSTRRHRIVPGLNLIVRSDIARLFVLSDGAFWPML